MQNTILQEAQIQNFCVDYIVCEFICNFCNTVILNVDTAWRRIRVSMFYENIAKIMQKRDYCG